ncbi:MAG: tRNA-dihydrouridine synthase family protein [Clostridia bacterium]|nr:tRNA-dihydrouridine synthase family protein [Clostridia bacterium]
METKPLNVGGIGLKGNILLAPLAGFTDYAFRGICLDLGASLSFTEMVSCKGLMYKNENTAILLKTSPAEKVKAAQIFGNDPAIMRAACESEYLAPFDIIDINMGCPVPKLFSNGEGSALLLDIPLAEKIISECRKSGKIITVKFRTGVTADKPVTAEFARACEGAGASMITVHGRPRSAYYSGEVNFKEIAAAKNAVNIPVIGNGGIFTPEDAARMFSLTGCDGVMIARGALHNPYVFSEITEKPFVKDIKGLLFRQINELKKIYPDGWVARNMRKQAACYLKGVKGGKQAKVRILSCDTTDGMKAAIDEVFG